MSTLLLWLPSFVYRQVRCELYLLCFSLSFFECTAHPVVAVQRCSCFVVLMLSPFVQSVLLLRALQLACMSVSSSATLLCCMLAVTALDMSHPCGRVLFPSFRSIATCCVLRLPRFAQSLLLLSPSEPLDSASLASLWGRQQQPLRCGQRFTNPQSTGQCRWPSTRTFVHWCQQHIILTHAWLLLWLLKLLLEKMMVMAASGNESVSLKVSIACCHTVVCGVSCRTCEANCTFWNSRHPN